MVDRRHNKTFFANWDDWARWAVGGLIAGLVGYAGIGSRLTAVEVKIASDEYQSTEERHRTQETIQDLSSQVMHLREDLLQYFQQKAK